MAYVLAKNETVPLIEIHENHANSVFASNYQDYQVFDEKTNELIINVHTTDNVGATPLHIYAQGKEILPIFKERQTSNEFKFSRKGLQLVKSIIDMFKKKEADLDARDKFQETPLHYAVKFGNFNVVYALCQFDIDIDAANKNGETPLHLACRNNYSNISKLLITGHCNLAGSETLHIKKKAIINKRDSSGNTPIHLAASSASYVILADLLKEGKLEGHISNAFINEPNVGGDTALLSALNCCGKKADKENGVAKVAKLLIENGALCNVQNKNGLTALHLAAKNGYLEIVKSILEMDCYCGDKTNKSGDFSLHLAARNGHLDVVEILLDYCLNYERPNANGFTPLDEAIINGHENVVEIFIAKGANIVREGDASCLHIAIDHNQNKIAEVLLTTDKWEELLRKSRKIKSDTCTSTPFRELLKANMHDAVKLVMDKCIKPVSQKIHNNDVNYEEAFNFTYLDDIAWNNGDRISESCGTCCCKICFNGNHPLSLMVERTTFTDERIYRGQLETLSHRLVRQLFLNKWTSYLILYVLEILLYAGFVGSLISYANIHPAPYDYESKSQEHPNEKPHYRNNIELFIILLTFTIVHLVKEVVLCFARGMIASATNIQNYFVISTYIFTLLFMFNCSSDGCPYYSGIKSDIPWIFGIIACFLAWINIIFLLNKNPALAIHLEMIAYVFSVFYNVFVFIFLFFILAFAMAFYMLFKNEDSFADYGTSITKTLVMMIGEFDYMTIFHADHGQINGIVNFPQTSTIFFWMFATTMTILFMNILIALSVDKISSFQNTAKLRQMKKAVKLLIEFELLKNWFSRKFRLFSTSTSPSSSSENIYIVFPNRKGNAFCVWFKRIVGIVLPICKDVNFEIDETSGAYNKINNKIEKLASSLEHLQNKQKVLLEGFEIRKTM